MRSKPDALSYMTLRWESTSPIHATGEPEDYIYESSGNIVAIDEDGESETTVGKFRVYYLDLDRAIDESYPIEDVFDAHSHLYEYYGALVDARSCGFRQSVFRAIREEPLVMNILIIDRVEILPRYRGYELGLDVMRHTVHRFGNGASVVAIKPYPLQFEARSERESQWTKSMSLDELPSTESSATRKLVSYYQRLGFQKVPRSRYMVASAYASTLIRSKN